MGTIPIGYVVDHINHNKTDNRLENLRIISRQENGRSWVRTGRRVSPTGDKGRSNYCKRGHPKIISSMGNMYCPTCRKLRKEGKIMRPIADWRATGFKGYSVNSEGQVWSKKTSCLLKGGVNGAGYRYVNINAKNYALHRLVANAFLGSISENDVVDHIDGDKLNNRSENLRILTQSENSFHYHSRRVEAGIVQIPQAEIKWLVLNTDIPQQAIADHYGIVQSAVASIKSGKLHSRVAPIQPTLTKLDQYVCKRNAICPVCGKYYELTRRDKKYCSLKCKGKARYIKIIGPL